MIPNKLIIHHSFTKDSQTVSWGAIRKYHTGMLGWAEVGYQWGLELIGDHYEILMGRPSNVTGAHTIGQNDQSIGICVVGNYDIDPVTDGIKDALHKLLSWLIVIYNISNHSIFGHCEFAPKTCPGKNLFEWVKEIRK
jgi:N-acetylmuramoyl-L-alanine amidase